METLKYVARRMLPTTGAIYYGTESFSMPDVLAESPSFALPPGTTVVIGYDFMCLIKDIRKTNCQDIQVSVWSVMTCIAAMVMIFCVVLIPIACIYRSGRFAGNSMKKMWGGGSKYNQYEEIEKRAARASDGVMPAPPKVSQFRQGPNYSNNDDDWED